jgi:hypothetical protein
MRRKKALGTTIQNSTPSFHRTDREGERYSGSLEDLAAVSLTFTVQCSAKNAAGYPLFSFTP